MKKFWGFVLAVLAIHFSDAQTRYIVQFKDKGTNPYSLSNPGSYLTQRSIDRRTRYSIAIDSTDLPITPGYIDSVRLAGSVTILNKSKWLNSVSIQTTDAAALTKINSFPFVQSVTYIAARTAGSQGKFENEEPGVLQQREQNILADVFNYGASYNQVHIHNGEFLHNIGLRGQGMVIGMLDGGFRNYLTLSSLDSARINGQILGVYDFVVKDSSVVEDDQHGSQTMSTIAANIPGTFIGTAPKASFYLFRTEFGPTEYPIEEHNWVCGAERVDSLGGDLISSSLGYANEMSDTSLDHTYSQMNGNTIMTSIGADLAAKKGMLVVNAAGNEGNRPWHYILSPADGDSVMAVGAVRSDGWAAELTSHGPTSDGQVKPDVASIGQGTIVQYSNGVIAGGNGTSFACPNMAGLTTCLWQGFREFNNMRIIDALRRAGNRFNNPNDSIGYGIPDVKEATLFLLKQFAATTASVANCKTTINWTSKDMSAMKYEIERMLAGQTSFTKIAEVQGTGNSFANRSYVYDDQLTNVLAGTHTYRIRQVIDTAASTFSADYIDTVTGNLTTNCTVTGINPVPSNETSVILSPNPSRGGLTIKITTPDAVQNLVIRIFDSRGQEISKLNRIKTSGTASFDISLVRFAKGKYYVSVYNGNKLIATKELVKL